MRIETMYYSHLFPMNELKDNARYHWKMVEIASR